MNQTVTFVVFSCVAIGIIAWLYNIQQKKKLLKQTLKQAFPDLWRDILKKDVLFYSNLTAADKTLFEKRIQLFLATKSIDEVETNIDDTIRLLVASSAIIPTFAFPDYNYPYVHSILIYPNSFDTKYHTDASGGHEKNILGMIGSSFQNGTVILSKPDLVKAFDGLPHKENVGIHEFVHLLDKEDGEIDGIPKILIDHSFAGPWLHEIKNEIKRIEKGNSDINPYAIASNAEFLAVVSEYFFNNPEKFQRKHPELYSFLSKIFNKKAINKEKVQTEKQE